MYWKTSACVVWLARRDIHLGAGENAGLPPMLDIQLSPFSLIFLFIISLGPEGVYELEAGLGKLGTCELPNVILLLVKD